MAISVGDLAEAAKSSLDEFLTQDVEDNIKIIHPLFDILMKKRKPFGGAKQNIVTSVRKAYGSNAAWTYGENAVSFNKRVTTENAQFPWRVIVDGYYIAWDTLYSNGINVREGKCGDFKLETNERNQLLNLLNEQNEAFRLGLLDKLDIELHRSGVSGVDAITGLDGLVTLNPAVGTVAGIDRSVAANAYWRNYAKTGIATATKGNLTNEMEIAWRSCIRNGGMPDKILMGSSFLDAYRQEVVLTQNADSGKAKSVDAGYSNIYFKGVEVDWDPNFSVLDALDAPATPWEKRCYFINSKYLNYRDNELNISNPTRPYTTRAIYTMAELRCALTSNRLNAHAVLAIA